MRRAARTLRAASVAVLAPLLAAQTANPNDLSAAMRKQVESADFRLTGHLVWVQPSGARLSAPISIVAHWFPGVLREYVEIGAAPMPGGGGLATHLLLEMRPNGQSSITIAHAGGKSPANLPVEKWSQGLLGPAFSYEDLLEQQYFWPSQASAGKATFGARNCDLLLSTPGAAGRTHYAEVKTWLDPGMQFPVYVEKTARESGMVTEFTYYGIRREEGVWSAHQIEAKVRGQAGSTLLILDHGSAHAHLTLAEFNPAKLTHF
jgi:hypothetical protein